MSPREERWVLMDAEILAELKAYLDEEIDKRSYELEVLKRIRELVEKELKEASFKSAAELVERKAEERVIPLLSKDGKVTLAELHVEKNKIRIVPSADLKVHHSSPPIASFLVGRVLASMVEEDNRLVDEGNLSDDERLRYEVSVSGDVIKEIVITNYRDQHRLNRIREAARWSFQKAYEQVGRK
ncbi:MAG: hypothetical protein KIH01_01670 [Candidatus Freyarchaeota archaeon]|nr:hypothetical protein [Candidatus Jordarchaeia archaeon]